MIFKFAVVQDILEKLVPASKVFEGEGLMIHEVAASIGVTTEALDEMIDDFDAENVPIDSNIHFFDLEADEIEANKWKLKQEYLKAGHESRKSANRETQVVEVDETVSVSECHLPAMRAGSKVAKDVRQLLNQRLRSSRVNFSRQ